MAARRRQNLIGVFESRFSVGICSPIRIFVLVTGQDSADNLWESVKTNISPAAHLP